MALDSCGAYARRIDGFIVVCERQKNRIRRRNSAGSDRNTDRLPESYGGTHDIAAALISRQRDPSAAEKDGTKHEDTICSLYNGRIFAHGIDGYMTVEASFIIPMVLCVIVIMIYTAFYLYDRCLFHQDAYLLCYRESICKEKEAPQNKIAADRAKTFGNKYFALSSVETAAKVEGHTIALTGTGKVRPAVFGQYFLMPKSIWTIRFAGAADVTDPPLKIRRFRRLLYIGGEVADLFR